MLNRVRKRHEIKNEWEMLRMNYIISYIKIPLISIPFMVFVIILMTGIVWSCKLRKNNDLIIKKLNSKFLYKYITLAMLIFTMIFAVITGITQFIYKDVFGYVMVYMFLLIIDSLVWVYCYYKINLFVWNPNDEELNESFEYFKEKKLSTVKYTEIITGLSQWIHYYFRLKANDNEQSDLIVKLHLLLRPDKNGLCLAAYHKNDFIELCERLCEYKDNDTRLKNITEAYNIMSFKEHEKYKLLSILFDKNILCYFVIGCAHFVGCVLISDDICSIVGNLFLYIPGDILLIFVYHGIVKEHKEMVSK